jgi:hypothetical protein
MSRFDADLHSGLGRALSKPCISKDIPSQDVIPTSSPSADISLSRPTICSGSAPRLDADLQSGTRVKQPLYLQSYTHTSFSPSADISLRKLEHDVPHPPYPPHFQDGGQIKRRRVCKTLIPILGRRSFGAALRSVHHLPLHMHGTPFCTVCYSYS